MRRHKAPADRATAVDNLRRVHAQAVQASEDGEEAADLWTLSEALDDLCDAVAALLAYEPAAAPPPDDDDEIPF